MRLPSVKQSPIALNARRGESSRSRFASSATSQQQDVVIATQPIIGMVQYEAERIIGELLETETPGIGPLDLSKKGFNRRASARAVRCFLTESDGEGYWDICKLSDGLTVSVMDAKYRQDTWINVEGSGFFKIRLLLSGELRAENGDVLVEGPQAMVVVSPGLTREGYFTAGGRWTRMVVLHGRPEVLTGSLGLEPKEIPPPLDRLLFDDQPADRRRIPFGSELAHAAQRIADSRHQLTAALRGSYIDALTMEILTLVLGDFSNSEMVRSASSAFGVRDLNRIHEAREYLAQHYVKPPTIPELARLIGTNQTKLKADFRQVTGMTLYDFILKCRMERAVELLMTGDYTVAEVAYRVGYDYPANFTYTFKKFHGCLPRAWTHQSGRVPALP